MLSPDYLEGASKEILAIYHKLEDSIVADIARRLVKMSYVSGATKWQMEQAQNAGALYNNILAELAKITGMSEAALQRLFDDATVEALTYDNRVYEAAGLTPIPISQSPAALQKLAAGLQKTAGTMHNLTMTTAIMAQTAYISASNLAYMQVQSGAFSLAQAVRNAIQAAAWQGAEVLYPSGRKDKLDVAIRRATLTGVNQTMSHVSLANVEAMGTTLVRVTAHSGARPEHEVWQGKTYSIVGRTDKYEDFYAVTGYGTGAGLCGWNCRHNFYPYFEDIDEEIYSAADLREMNRAKYEYNGKKYTEYEVSQMQRGMERRIRQTRRELVAYDEAMSNTLFDEIKDEIRVDFAQAAVKLKAQEARLKDLLAQTRFRNKTERLQVAGFGRSVSQKAVAADKKEYFAWTKSISPSAAGLPKTVDEYRRIKYTDAKEYGLLRAYARAVDKGDISPLVGYDVYKATAKTVEETLVGMVTANGIEITGYSPHFIDRLIGQVSTPHPGRRSSVSVDSAKEALTSPTKIGPIKTRPDGLQSVTFTGKNCKVSINPKTGNLVQTNPRKER